MSTASGSQIIHSCYLRIAKLYFPPSLRNSNKQTKGKKTNCKNNDPCQTPKKEKRNTSILGCFFFHHFLYIFWYNFYFFYYLTIDQNIWIFSFITPFIFLELLLFTQRLSRHGVYLNLKNKDVSFIRTLVSSEFFKHLLA